jgi:hypothetical protein
MIEACRAFAIAAAVAAVACDGQLVVEGRVYGRTTTGAVGDSVAIVDADPEALPADLIALEGAEIAIEPWRPDERAQHSDGEVWVARTVSGNDGSFSVRKVARWGRWDATLTVSAPGYLPVEQVFRHGPGPSHRAVVVLVRDRTRE